MLAGAVFLVGLGGAGLIGPDEPRYASIGREMARSGDWITPRLWGEPWFEKPPLLYWLIAAGNLAGLGEETAPRLPVALVSLAFLLFYYRTLRLEFGAEAALYATIVLGACAGWVAYSYVAVTDLPMAAAFSAAMLLALRWRSQGGRLTPVAAGFFLGLAVLAKGLVPLALALPLLWLLGRRLREWLRPAPLAAFFLTALPWYAACALRHGAPFLEEFFLRHHFARFFEGAALHERPVWFYLPVLAAGVFPWLPLWALLSKPGLYRERAPRFLLLWVVWGLVFLSASSGKLPGYLLPLFPALAALGGVALAKSRRARWAIAGTVAFLALLPVIRGTLPGALAEGLSRTPIAGWSWGAAAACGVAAGGVWWLDRRGRRLLAVVAAGVCCAGGIAYLKMWMLPEVDRLASARPVWRQVQRSAADVCLDNVPRSWRYGLYYYAGRPVDECSLTPRPWRIVRRGDVLALESRVNPSP